jgi:hypothetical protein
VIVFPFKTSYNNSNSDIIINKIETLVSAVEDNKLFLLANFPSIKDIEENFKIFSTNSRRHSRQHLKF